VSNTSLGFSVPNIPKYLSFSLTCYFLGLQKWSWGWGELRLTQTCFESALRRGTSNFIQTVHWEEWGLLKLHSWFPFEVGPLCVLICGSIARYVVDSLFYSLWLHLFCVVLSVSLPLSVWRPRHSLRARHVRRTLARTLAPMVVHW